MQPGISIIIQIQAGTSYTKRLLDTFLETNTHDPVELIMVDHGPTKKTAALASGFATQAFIRLVKVNSDTPFGLSCNLAAGRAIHPYLLFLADNSIFTADLLTSAVKKLSDANFAAVGLQLDNASLPLHRDVNRTNDPIHTLNGLLCRKADVQKRCERDRTIDRCQSIGSLANTLMHHTGRKTIWLWSKQDGQACWTSLEMTQCKNEAVMPEQSRTIEPSPKASPANAILNNTPSTRSASTVKRDYGPLPAADIIICVHNALEDVQNCLDSIRRTTDLNRHHLIIVDDGSNPATKQLLIGYVIGTGASYIRNNTPQGYTKAANQGIRKATRDILLLLNSDTVTTPGWLERLITCAVSRPNIACVGPLSNAASWQSIPQLTAASGQWLVNPLPEGVILDDYAARIAAHSPRLYPGADFINGFCLLITRPVLNKIGLLDEDTFPRGYGEEDDFCLRALDAGFGHAVADDCYIYHAKSKSFTPEGRAAIVATSKDKLAGKHGKRRIRQHIQKTQENEHLLIARTWARLAASRSMDHDQTFGLNEPRKSLHLGWLQPHLNCVGGIRRTIEITNRLVSWGHQVHLITPDGLKSDWLPIFSEVTTVEAARHMRFDVLLLSDPDMVGYYKTMNAALTVNYHLAAYMLYRETNKHLKQYYALDPAVIHIANSTWTAEQAGTHHGIEMQGIFPGGVDKRIFHPYNCDKPFDIVCYGSMRPHKGTADIQAASGNHRLLKLEQLDLNQQNLARHICSGKIFVSGCWHEGFNFCPLEAMSCGVPVVMTDCGGSREYAVNEFNALVVPPQNTKAMTAAIQRLLSDAALRLKLIENGLETAWKYDWQAITQRFSDLLENSFMKVGRP